MKPTVPSVAIAGQYLNTLWDISWG